ncbi:MAG: hypothetical protein K2J47_00380 [Ruminococcus sp.]|nr:hypothetical protein [Ruminococcus sp.]
MMRVYDKKYANKNAVKNVADDVATGATYLGVPFIAVTSTFGTILGAGVTICGALATSISLGNGFHKSGYEKSLAKSIKNDNYNLVLTTYDFSESLYSQLFMDSDYYDSAMDTSNYFGSALWSNWEKPKYINRIIGKSVLNVSVGTQNGEQNWYHNITQ